MIQIEVLSKSSDSFVSSVGTMKDSQSDAPASNMNNNPISSTKSSHWPYFSVRLWRHFVNFWVKIEVIKHMLS